MIDSDDYDCLKCGACCVATIETVEYVNLRVEDVERLTRSEQERFVHTTTALAERPQTGMKTRHVQGDCRCAALDGKIGERVSCSVYDRRPAACRLFPAGSNVCNYARQFVLGISLK